MKKRSAHFLLDIFSAAALAMPGTFLAGLSGGALAAEPAIGRGAPAESLLPAQPSGGWYQFGPAATIISREEIAADSVTLVTLSNGVRVVLKPTHLVKDEVLVNVWVNGGYQSLAPGNRAAADIETGTTFMESGVGLKTYEELIAQFGRVASSIEFDIWDSAFNFGGKAQPSELRSLLEILTAYVGDPGWRLDGFDASKEQTIKYAAEVRSNPSIALATQSVGLLTSGDPRYTQPSAAQYSAVRGADVRRAIEAPFKSGAIEIAIVGDFDLEATLAMAAATFGTLPARADGARDIGAPRFPPHSLTPIELTFDGYPEQQGRMVAWPAPLGLFKSKEEQVISAMFGVMGNKLKDLPAYKLGSFGGGLKAQHGYMSFSAVGRRDKLSNFEVDVARIARDIIAHGVTQKEIDRAQARTATDTKLFLSQAPNPYWLVAAINLKGDRANWERARSFTSYAEGVTPEEVQTAAARYLNRDKSVSIVANPSTPGKLPAASAAPQGEVN